MKTAATILLIALLAALGAWAISFPIYNLRRWFGLRHKGYFVAHTRYHPVVYEERFGDDFMAIGIQCTPVDELGRFRVIIPSRADWHGFAPDWSER